MGTERGRRGISAGFSLIEVLVVVVLLLLVSAFLLNRYAGLGGNAGEKKVATPKQRARQVEGVTYRLQINQAMTMYREDHEGQNPPSLEALKTYGVTDEMLVDPVTRQPLPYDPATGTVGATPGTNLPRVPGY
jgi:prepilin-type N-terminal cleavage/methylation domain-containing protein